MVTTTIRTIDDLMVRGPTGQEVSFGVFGVKARNLPVRQPAHPGTLGDLCYKPSWSGDHL